MRLAEKCSSDRDFNQQANPVETSAKHFWGIGLMIDWSDLKAGI